MNSGIKREISKSLKMGYQTVSNSLNILSKKGIIKRQDTGIYFLNPFLFGKGNWNTIQNLRLKINYDFISRKKTMEVETTNSVNSEENNKETEKAEEKKQKKTNVTANSRANPNLQTNATI
jgi:DNA-binding transcriptional regulator GbsR (MarR family)